MAVAVISVLSQFPWGTMIENGPRIAEQAMRVVNVFRRDRGQPEPLLIASADQTLAVTVSAQQERLIELEARAAQLAETVLSLSQMQEALVLRLRQVQWIAIVGGGLALVATIGWIAELMR